MLNVASQLTCLGVGPLVVLSRSVPPGRVRCSQPPARSPPPTATQTNSPNTERRPQCNRVTISYFSQFNLFVVQRGSQIPSALCLCGSINPNRLPSIPRRLYFSSRQQWRRLGRRFTVRPLSVILALILFSHSPGLSHAHLAPLLWRGLTPHAAFLRHTFSSPLSV